MLKMLSYVPFGKKAGFQAVLIFMHFSNVLQPGGAVKLVALLLDLPGGEHHQIRPDRYYRGNRACPAHDRRNLLSGTLKLKPSWRQTLEQFTVVMTERVIFIIFQQCPNPVRGEF